MYITSSEPHRHHFANRRYTNSMNTSWSSSSVSSFSSSSQALGSSPRNIHHRQRTVPRLRSNLSAIDSQFIELTRCLYQAKTIVQDLTSFHFSILPMLSLSKLHDTTTPPQSGVGSAAFHQHIKQYLDDNFTKFTKMCKVLMMILSRLEQNQQVRQERILSFRNEIMEEWRVASDIKRRIHAYLQQNNSIFDGSSSCANDVGSASPSPTTPSPVPHTPSS
ncbi:hypothetical protein [Absidia glauca]|uniref:Uncharacterized protein n=1 Tax=Absidia glauca TaxID=4829 RepID=A0A163MQ12_ABSGL|nr:hypothetical protein [Absidia glauca]